ncbi:MAG: hypothetical protein ABSB67_20420 [Bryobacteraceae bacterium]
MTGGSSQYMSMQYYDNAGQDNGKIQSTTTNVSGEQVVYQYDTLKRLIQAQAASNSWGQQYVYDGFGNLYQKNVTAGSAPSMGFVVDPTTDRLTNPGGTAFTYDANGNETGGP